MSCSCTASAPRLFARGLAQVHRSERGMSFALPVRSAAGARFAGALASQHRSIHASRALRDAEDSTSVKSIPEEQPASTEASESPESRTPTEPDRNTYPRTHEEVITEARAKAAWRFKQQGFDWKAFRSKDPAVRATADFSNFDWENWQGNKHAGKGLHKLVDNLEAARAAGRAAIGLSADDGYGSRSYDHRKRQAEWRKMNAEAMEQHNQTLEAEAATSPKREQRQIHEDDVTPFNREQWQIQKNEVTRPPKREPWQIQKEALKAKFPEGWRPHKRLSPDALAGIRALNAQFPDVYTTRTLAEKFAMSPEAIRRILKSKWTPTADEDEDRQARWHRRGMKVWEHKAELGIKPPKRWRDEGIARDPDIHAQKHAQRIERQERLHKERDEYMRSFAEIAEVKRLEAAGVKMDEDEGEASNGGRGRRREKTPHWMGRGSKKGKKDLDQALRSGRRK
ncbi:Required for respiratory growth protein 9 [Beauveria bassiana D1-5]|uniref:Required for respiratory growth protein 9, mitochondrial n=1 Tax=Beauveria bassiana D1-5 TaxID=1245745 RepID=A0A0A2VH63_BEABA|nr:Required for respiratory growth protein 9 [Beauveria bassiana D1-5]